jgi:hypothetical protein
MSTSVKKWKQLECPPKDEWIKKMWYVHHRILIKCDEPSYSGQQRSKHEYHAK